MAKILIVEDETSLLEVYAEVLEAEGHQVLRAFDGDTGLNTALHQEWDIMFLDIMLPGLDGIEILKKLSQEGMLENHKVVMLSNLDSPDVVDESLKLGAVKHLSKSNVTPQIVVSTVQELLGGE